MGSWNTFLSSETAPIVLFPLWKFNHAQGCGKITKFMAYKMFNHLREQNPTDHAHLHLPVRVMACLNGAKGSLRITLGRGLWNPVKPLIDGNSTCSCKEKTFRDYTSKLYKCTRVFLFEDVYKRKSMNDVLDQLAAF
jgi:hypothetical protein